MKTKEERKDKTAEGMELEMEDREAFRREREQGRFEDLNQGIQTGTYDSRRTGIKWGPSYRLRKKARKPKAKE